MVEDLTFCQFFSLFENIFFFLRCVFFSFEGFPQLIVGVYYGEDPPVPIPNTVVKLVRAEDTWRAASRKNRSMPTQHSITVLFFLFLLSSVGRAHDC